MENQKGLFLISIVLKNDDKSLLWFAAVKGIFCQINFFKYTAGILCLREKL